MSSGCGDVLTLEDLKTAKKHQIFEAEVITGRTGGVAGGAEIDYAINPVTGDSQKTLPAVLRDAGFSPVSWDFSTGGMLSINDRDKVVFDDTTKTWYSWSGNLPHTVAAGTDPKADARWVPQTDPNIFTELAANTGAGKIGAVATDGSNTTVQKFLSANDIASYKNRCLRKLAEIDYAIHANGSFTAVELGDSLTAGFDRISTDIVPPAGEDWASHATMTYPTRFAAYLTEQSGCTVTSVVRAISGFTAQQAYDRAEWQSNPHGDIVFIMYGVNDADPASGATHESYMEYMEKLARRYIDWGHAVCFVTPAAGGFGSQQAQANRLARQIKNLATAYGCAFFNGAEIQYNRYAAAVQSDATHFNSNGYARVGEALASMCMAGGLLPSYRPISSEFTAWPGIVSDQMGYSNSGNEISVARFPDAAYTLQGISGAFTANKYSTMAFSFYLDAEAAEVDLVGSWTTNSKLRFIATNKTASQAGPAVNYYISQTQSSNLAEQVTQYGEGEGHVYPTAATGAPKHLGLLSGRGWKTITIYAPQDGSGGTDAYIQQLTVRPIPRNLAYRQSPGTVRKGIAEMIMCSLPARDNLSAGLPPAVTLSSVVLPLPFDLNPLAWEAQLNYFDCGFAKLLISGSHGADVFYYEALLSRRTTGAGLAVTALHKVGTEPTVAATIGTKDDKILVAAGSQGTYMPLENIRVLGDDSTFTPGTVGNKRGLFIKLDFAWTGTAPQGYYNIALQSFARGLGGASSLVTV